MTSLKCDNIVSLSKVFDDIECEWPLFWTYMILDGIFFKKRDQVMEYREALDELLVIDNGLKVLPELYTVPAELVSPNLECRLLRQ